MTLDENKPENYGHVNGTKVLAIHKLKKEGFDFTHIIETEDYQPLFWNKSFSWLVEIPKERWQGLSLRPDGSILGVSTYVVDFFSEIQEQKWCAAINLDTLQIVKL